LRLAPEPGESLDCFFRRRKRDARDLVEKHGSWAIMWAKRLVAWNDHVLRSARHGCLLGKLVSWHSAQWLQQQRSNFVISNPQVFRATRNSVWAGRTGTRCYGSKPQKRFHDGVELARQVVNQSRVSASNSHALSLYTVFQRAASVFCEDPIVN
jgi:hypothetical protein